MVNAKLLFFVVNRAFSASGFAYLIYFFKSWSIFDVFMGVIIFWFAFYFFKLGEAYEIALKLDRDERISRLPRRTRRLIGKKFKGKSD